MARRRKSNEIGPRDPEKPVESPESGPADRPREADKHRPSLPSGRARRRWTVVDYALAVALVVSCAVLGWQVYRTYFSRRPRPLPPPSAGDLCARLRDRGDVLAIGRDGLPSCPTHGVRLRTPADLTPDGRLEELLSARDDGPVADLLAAKGVRTVVVATSLANPSLLPKVSVRNGLALFKPSERFRALYLSEAAGLYEVVPGTLQVSDEEGTALLRLARAELAGTEVGGPLPPGLDVAGDFEVGLQFQGLPPDTGQVPAPEGKKNRKAYTRRTRPAVFAGGRGRTLAEAVRLGARNLRDAYVAKGMAEKNGPLEQAVSHLTLEVEVFYDWTDVATFTAVRPAERGKPADPGERRYKSFLWRSIELGLHGIALGRDTDHYRFRLPSDAVYAGREEVEDLLARVCLDLLSRDKDALQQARLAAGKPKGSSGELSEIAYRTDPKLRVQRFRAHHFPETGPGGDVVRLSRGIPPVAFAPGTVGREALRQSIYWATRWLVENVQPDGRFHYRYFPETDHYLSDEQVVEDYNEVRHGLATYSLFMSEREVPADDLRAAAEKSLRWILDSVVFGPAWTGDPARRTSLPSWVVAGKAFGPPGKEGKTGAADFWRCQHGYRRPIPREMAYVRHLDNAKMGAVAAAVLPISEKVLRTPEAERAAVLELYRPFLEGFASFLLFMQHTSGPDAGMCDHYFVTPDNASYKRSTTIYPGEILFGLSRIYRLTGDPRIPPAFAMAVEYERGYFERESAIREPDGTYFDPRRADLVQFVPWISMAMNDMVIAIAEEDPEHAREYSDFGIRVSEWVADEYLFDEARSFYPEYLGGYFKWEFELPAMHSMVYAEGTAAAFDLAQRMGDPREEAMRRATILGCRFAAQQIVVPGRNDHFMPDPARARGGVRFGINDSDMRTDFSYHTLSALNQTLRYMTDEELAPW